MTHSEAIGWSEYIRRRGSLNFGMRLEQGVAQLMSLMINRTGGNNGRPVKAADFVIHKDPEPPISLADAMRDWK